MRPAIKVLVVDDSALVRQMLTRALGVDPRIEIVGSAKNGIEAIERATETQPDVITLDIEMPELNGIEALPHLLKVTPARVVILSSIDDPDTTYQALSLGAVDFIPKPREGFASSLAELSDLLIKKIKIAYRVSPAHRQTIAQAGTLAPPKKISKAEEPSSGATPPSGPFRAVAFAASTGGPPALEAVFSGLSASLPAAYLVVQHLPAGFTASLARRLGKVTDIRMAEATEGMPVERGVAYIAPHGSHMMVEGDRTPRIRLEQSPAIHGVRPAADPLLESVARRFGSHAVGVVLTGMGVDGAHGLKLIQQRGGSTIVQDENTSVVWGMPKAAVKIGAVDRIVPLQRISTEVRRCLREEA
ncbi:MAG: chemotaxis response regulator protein-glutamate methylesterase [Coriobacteriales bacterium]|nr:chemotaxis response regulator protein-glutamate methylesterase [Actinomycetes bacterium]